MLMSGVTIKDIRKHNTHVQNVAALVQFMIVSVKKEWKSFALPTITEIKRRNQRVSDNIGSIH